MADTRDVLSVLFGRREVAVTTVAEDYRYLRRNWSDVYLIIRPGPPVDEWRAMARFGKGDVLIAETADELLALIRRHYGPSTEGYTEMLMNRLGKKYT